MMHPAINKMVPPGQKRPGIFRNGIMQIMITRSCDQACFGCTAGSNLKHTPSTMSVEQFDEALVSMEGYFGIIACFGGNPCTHPRFDQICERMRSRIPFTRRGLWTNNLMGKGAHARITFNPNTSNVNVHKSQEAYAEFERDWPEALKAREQHCRDGLEMDSLHGTPWVSMVDLGIPKETRYQYMTECEINRHWSAMICLVRGELKAFFCECAGHMAALHADNPNWAGTGEPMKEIGLPVVRDWWRQPMASFEQQVETCCHNCAIPLRRPGQQAINGDHEEFSITHQYIARPKVRNRPVQIVSIGDVPSRTDRPSTQYLPGVTPGYHGQ